MKTCLLNPPYSVKIMRRYNCTYYAPNFLFPPIELMYLGAIIRKWKGDDCILIDAVAQRLSLNKVIRRLKNYQPDLLVFIAGIESCVEDLRAIKIIKYHFPLLKTVCIGYLPSIFPKETLENNHGIDYIIMHEPEVSFSEVYDKLKKANLSNFPTEGVAHRYDGKIIVGRQRPRIRELDILPFPDISLLHQSSYNEFLLPKPFTTIQTSRGCPFECIYCIPSYGKDIYFRSLENILGEIEEAILKYKIKTIRFTDDTFSLNKERVERLCDSILKKKFKFHWSALTRIDRVDKEILSLMQRAGLRRIYLGIETGSQRILDFYKKGYKTGALGEQVKNIKKNNIEAVGFFMVGGIQTEEELRQDISLAKELNLDYVIVEKLTSYPGTPLFNLLKDTGLSKKAAKWEKIFYRDFYLRFSYITSRFWRFIYNIKDLLLGIGGLWQWLIFDYPLQRFFRKENCDSS